MHRLVNRGIYLALFAALSLVLLAGSWTPASAQTLSSNLNLTATVLPECTGLTANALSFGNYSNSSGNEATTTITVNCPAGVTYALDAGSGNNFVGGVGRQLFYQGLFGVDGYLIYNLYKEAAHTNVWGNGAGGTPISGSGTGSDDSIIIYGLIPSGQDPPEGPAYGDTVVVTVWY